MKKSLKKTISYLLILCLLLQTTVVNFAYAATSTEAIRKVTLGDTMLDVKQNLKENADGSYTLDLTLSAELSNVDKNEDKKVSKNNYFTAQETGTYIIELWGGDGARGTNTSYSDGGAGGAGGYVYGTIDLKKGETLFYTLGGDGMPTTVSDVGGGVNGSGGGHGDLGSYSVGGGGGYSAVYKFEANEFDKYVDKNGKLIVENISEEDRISKYIMIAAGGGGGGAGNGFSFGTTAIRTPDGGAGGNMSSDSGELKNTLGQSQYAVEGVFFEGEDGKSSGTSFEYIGHGGTYEPGKISDTSTTLIRGKEPNDWAGTINRNYAGGAGGSGNYRGGAGGAGFCGGSGGVMTNLLQATNVGGGGGGSSFIAKEITYKNISNEAKAKMLNTNLSETGGMINIALVDDVVSKNINVSTKISKYFDFVNVTGATYDISGKNLILSDISLDSDRTPKTVQITLKPISGFAGGNNVPLFETALKFTHGSDEDILSLSEISETTHVNVPLNFEVITNSYSYDTEQSAFAVEKLYESYKATHAGLLEKFQTDFKYDFKYDFIKSIGEIVVRDPLNNIVSGNINIDKTTRFNVGYLVELEDNGVADVGREIPLETIISKEAVVSIIKPGELVLNDIKMQYSKSLTHSDGKYTLSLNFKGESSDSTIIVTKPEPVQAPFGKTTSSFTVEKSGYYLIQAWGGNGGKGADNSTTAGDGGSGGYISAYGHFDAGDIIYYTIGANGNPATDNSSGGNGGVYSSVSMKDKDSTNTEYILIAAGGGGGGNGSTAWGWAGDGGDGASVTDAISNSLEGLSSYTGKPGSKGGDALWGAVGVGGAGGEAGTNYLNNGKLSQDTSENSYDLGEKTDYTNNGGGAVYISCLELDYNGKDDTTVKNELNAKLSKYNLNAQISKYFDIDRVTFEGVDSKNSPVVNDYVSNNIINLTNINPEFEITDDGNDDGPKTYTYSFDYTVNIQLTPKQGFLGGNDVPVLVYNNAKYATGMQISQNITDSEVKNIAEKNETDYANVEIPFSIISADLTTYDKTYIKGCDGVDKDELYTLSSEKNDVLNKSYDWEDDFVNVVKPADDLDSVLEPTETTTYLITAGIMPNNSAKKAVVIDSVEDKTVTKESTIYVDYQAIYALGNITTDATSTKVNDIDIYVIDTTKDYAVTLVPSDGYSLPDNILVTRGGNNIDFSYDSDTGELIIPKKELTDNIKIEAEGKIVTYTLNYVYQQWSDEKQRMETHTVKYEYPAGAPITDNFTVTYDPKEYPYEGHTFTWEWATENGQKLEYMPAQNWWVIGQYVANEYTLTINYTCPKVEIPSVIKQVRYGDSYNIVSPIIPGHVTKDITVSGTMPAKNVEVNVEYTPTDNDLTIIYIQADTNEECAPRNSMDVATGKSYSVASPTVKGYTPDKSVVSGTMDADGEIVYVYYTPNKYKVTFVADDSNLSDEEKTRTVVYNNLYGYSYSKDGDDETLTYTQFPSPTRIGYRFDGWYTEPNGKGSLVREDSKVEITENLTLYANWEANDYTVTVDFQYEDGTKAAESYKETYHLGDDYNLTYENEIPKITGYTPNKTVIKGKIGAQNVREIVTYVANEYTLTINYKKSGEDDPFKVHTQQVKYGSQYSVISPELEGFIVSSDVVEGTMPANDREITVIYYEVLPTISVTVEWGDLSFNYKRGEWNTETLTSGPDIIEPTNLGNNKIIVKNNDASTVPVEADLVYESANKYSTLIGFFTPTEDVGIGQSERVYTTASIDRNSSATTYFWLKGTLNNDVEGTITSGTCEVTIRGGN